MGDGVGITGREWGIGSKFSFLYSSRCAYKAKKKKN